MMAQNARLVRKRPVGGLVAACQFFQPFRQLAEVFKAFTAIFIEALTPIRPRRVLLRCIIASMPLHIQEIPSNQAPLALLLLADPSEAKVRAYLPRSRCFVASHAGAAVAACAVQPVDEGDYELMSIAVAEAHHRQGHGSALLRWVILAYRLNGARQLLVGTGSFGYQLAFYQRQGFRVTGIARDFFVQHYPDPIIEDGIQLRDMLRLSLPLHDGPA